MAKLKGGTRIYGSLIIDDQTLIGTGTSTGTAGQSLQIAGINSSAYIGGRVGVGTTNPSVPLEVVGAVRATVYYGDGSNLTGIVASGGGGGTSLSISTSTSSSTNFISFVSSAGTSILGITTAIGLTYIPSTGNLNVGIISIGSGIITATSAAGIVTYYGDGSKLTNVFTVGSAITGTNIVGSAISISGISTFNTVRISSGIITATSGVVTYFGDGSRLTGIQTIGSVSGAGGTFTQIQFNDSGALSGASFFNYDKGTARVGIGTSLPTARLSVASSTTGASLMVVNDNLSDGALFRVTDNSANILMDVDANGIIVFNNSGNIGIGTTLVTPTSKLQVVGDALVSGVVTASTALSVGAGGTIITATSTGLVGIGTINPTSRLTVSGNALISGVSTLGTVQISSGIITATSGVVTYFGDGSKLSGILTSGSAGGSTGQVQFNLGGNPTGANFFNYDNATSRVGIGTSLPTARLSVASSTTGTSLMVVNDNLSDGSLFRVTDNSANILMDVDANGTIVFNNSGNIGIGTTIVTPTSKLQVIGDALISGVVTATTHVGNLTGTAVTATTGIITNIVGTAATISTVRILSGIITATSGVVTYYGSGAFLTGIVTSGAAGQGAPGQVQINDSGPLAGASFFHYDKTSVRVGIGTSLPTARLSVASSTTGTSLMVVNDNLSDGALFRVTDNSANILMDVDANGTIVFNNSGNIGIGTTLVTPTSKLQVIGDALVSGVVTATTFSGNLSGIALTVTTGIITNITSVNQNISGVTTTQRLNVGTGGTIFTTTSTGLVGIGTSVPASRFNVSSPSTGNSLMVVNDNLSDGALFRVNDNNANVLIDIDANGTILFPALGNVGIGSTLTTPTSKLHVIGNVLVSGIVTATTGIITNITSINENVSGVTTTQTFNVGTGGTIIATTSSGLVGIGSTVPTSRLTVSGDTLITGIATVGLGATSTPPSNSQLSFELTSNTNLRIKVRGTDGVLRTANITLG